MLDGIVVEGRLEGRNWSYARVTSRGVISSSEHKCLEAEASQGDKGKKIHRMQ